MSFNTALSGLQAATVDLSVTSNNIANDQSARFKKSTTILAAAADGTVTSRIQPVNTPGVMISQADGSMEELSNVDLGQELVGMLPTQHGYETNLKALQASGEMQDTVLDLIA